MPHVESMKDRGGQLGAPATSTTALTEDHTDMRKFTRRIAAAVVLAGTPALISSAVAAPSQASTTVLDNGADPVTASGPSLFFAPTVHALFPSAGTLPSDAPAQANQGAVTAQQANATVLANGVDTVTASGPSLLFAPTVHALFPSAGTLPSDAPAQINQGAVTAGQANTTVLDNGVDKVTASGPSLFFAPKVHTTFPLDDHSKADPGRHSVHSRPQAGPMQLSLPQ